MKKNKKYTEEEIVEMLRKMMFFLADMINSCDDRDNIGLVFAYGKLTGQVGDSATFHTISDWVGDYAMGTCALAAFLDKNKDMGEAVKHTDLVNITEMFGLNK